MRYRIETKPAFDRDFDRLPRHVQRRIVSCVDRLADNPRPPGCKRLSGSTGIIRVRVGDYRILYQVNDQDRVVTIARVRHRREAYRDL